MDSHHSHRQAADHPRRVVHENLAGSVGHLELGAALELPAGTGQQELQVASPLSVSVTEPPRRRFSIRGSSNNGTKSHGRQFGLFGPKRCAAAQAAPPVQPN